MLFISTGIFDDKLRPQILSVGSTANSLLKSHFLITEGVGLIRRGLLHCGETYAFLDPNLCGLLIKDLFVDSEIPKIEYQNIKKLVSFIETAFVNGHTKSYFVGILNIWISSPTM